MALVLADRVRETTTTTGTGTITLAGAVGGYQSFSVVGNGNTTYYCIASQTLTEWEVGIGTWATGGTLARTTILASSNAGSTVTFSAGTKDVFITYPAGYTVNTQTGTATAATTAANLSGTQTANYFYAAPNGSSGAGAWRAFVAADLGTAMAPQLGSLGVGTAASGTTGEIRATNNVTAYYSSDAKFKENIKPIQGASEIIRGIGGDYFDWTDEYIADHGGEDGYFIQKEDFGVIAQKVQKVFPKAVRTRPDGSLAVDYEKLGVLAFPAIIEILDRLDALEAKDAK